MLALLCSGQGFQHADMFALTGRVPAAAPLFEHAAKVLGGRDPREGVGSESGDALYANRIGQVLCALQALAAGAALADAWPKRRLVAGYSVGEVAAWSVAGLLEPSTTLDLVVRRAEAMDAVSVPGDGMLHVRGLPADVVDALCRRHHVAVAIVNPGDAWVIGGSAAALAALAGDAKREGAERVTTIAVSVASHTPRLAAASPVFRAALANVPVAPLRQDVRLFSGIDAAPVLDVATGLDKLAAQVSSTVHWAVCLEACVEAGATAFLELGPGGALAAMATQAFPDIPARNIDAFRSLDGVRQWIARQAG